MLDIIIIGSGIIGSSVARELSRYNATILVIDKESDVACGTTKANSGIVHAGFDTVNKTLKSKFNVEGNVMFDETSKELDFPFKRNGAFVIAFDAESELKLEELYNNGLRNGVKGLRIISGEEARSIEKHLSVNVTKVLYATTSGIVSPYEMALAYAENALTNKVGFKFNSKVENIEKIEQGFRVITANAYYDARVVINAAGVHADEINNLVSNNEIKIIARKGEYLLLDKLNADYTNTTIFQTPAKMGKGVVVTPAVHGNIMVGPTAVDIDNKDDVSTSISGLDEVWNKGLKTVPTLNRKAIITSFAGLRAHSITDDFIIGFSEVAGFYNIAGIESPGLTSAPAIAKHVSTEIADYLSLKPNPNFIGKRVGIKHFLALSDDEKRKAIQENPLYGRIICRCEVISEAEIVDSINRPLGAVDLDGIKRRTRATMGRCHGGFCTPKIMEILSNIQKVDMEDITKDGRKSNVLVRKD